MTGDGYKNIGSDFNGGEADTGEDVADARTDVNPCRLDGVAIN